MAGSRVWRPLPLSAPGVPSLLVSTQFTAQSYTICITDLANVWEECLEKKPIIMRALKEDTSIDPTDGPDQIRKLLDLVHAAFDPAADEHNDTSLALSSGGGGGPDTLTVHVSVALPGGLKHLEWPVYLGRLARSAVATELVIPLVRAQHARAQELTELAGALRDKDGVISKLADKLEAVGTGLENVFTSLSGRRKVTRAVAEDRVRGFRPFDEAEFRQRSNAGAQPPGLPALLDSVFGGDGLACGADSDAVDDAPRDDDDNGDRDGWWTALGKGRPVALAERKKKDRPSGNPPAPSQKVTITGQHKEGGHGSEEDSDDDFQVQATPPHLAAARKRDTGARQPQTAAESDDETSDGDNDPSLDGGVMSSQRPIGHAVGGRSKIAPGSRLGTISTRTKKPSPAAPPSHSGSPPAAQKKKAVAEKRPSDSGSDTASDVEEDGDGDGNEGAMDTTMSRGPSPRRPTAARAATPPAQPKRAALGRIGGRAKAAEVSLEQRPSRPDPDDDGPSSSAAPAATTPKRGKLGVIGRKAGGGGVKATAEAERESRGRSVAPKEDSEEDRPRETSQERADRKRAELQAQLQKRATSGPAKKKRKF